MREFLRKYFFGLILLGGFFTAQAHSQISINQPDISFRETVWLQVPGKIHIPGERLLFHAALLETDTYNPSRLSRSIRIELLDSEGNRLSRQNLALDHSKTTGHIDLQPDLKTGWYYIRAYSNWMRNFPVSEFTVLPVKVINPADKGAPRPSDENPDTLKTNARKSGLQLKKSGDQIIVTIPDSDNAGTSLLRLLVHRTSSWYWFESKPVQEGGLEFLVPAEKIPDGIVQFSVLRNDNSILASRLWSGYDTEKHKVSIGPATRQPGIRTACEANYTLPAGVFPDSTSGINALITLAEPGEQDEATFPGLPGWSAGEWIPIDNNAFGKWLDQNGYPDEVARAFFRIDQDKPLSPVELNLPDLNQSPILYFPETRAGIISGRVINRETGDKVPSVGIGIKFLNNNGFEAVKTNNNGVFAFSCPNLMQSADFILSFISEPDPQWIIEVIPEYDSRIFIPEKSPFTLSEEELNYAANMSINLQLSQIYTSPVAGIDNLSSPPPMKRPFYDPADRVINTDDYIELANLLEVIYEVVPDVQVRRKGNQAFVSVYNKNSYARDYETLILVDGIPLTSHKELLDLPPGRIKTIEVKNRVYIHGNYIFSSVVNFISRNQDFAGLKLPASAVSGSIDLPVIAEGTDQDNQSPPVSARPVLNPVLLWTGVDSPHEGKINFLTNDLYGNFKILLYGIDQNGLWFCGQHLFSVQPPTP